MPISPRAKGFLYLVAVLDWHSRYVLSWDLSNTLDVGFCLSALHMAMTTQPVPFIFNSDQGSQFTSQLFEQALLTTGYRINRNGRGRATDIAVSYTVYLMRCSDASLRLSVERRRCSGAHE